MKKPFLIVIFGDRRDKSVLQLVGVLTQCGIYNFADGRIEHGGLVSNEQQVCLMIVARASVSPAQMESIKAEARRLVVPVLYL